MSKYSDEEIRAFQLKDILNCRMSALKAASINYEGTSTAAITIKKDADEFFNWLRQDQDEVKSVEPEKPKSEVLPQPTLVQKKVIDAVCEGLNMEDSEYIRIDILDWVEMNYGKRVYPTKLESVNKIVNDLKGN